MLSRLGHLVGLSSLFCYLRTFKIGVSETHVRSRSECVEIVSPPLLHGVRDFSMSSGSDEVTHLLHVASLDM